MSDWFRTKSVLAEALELPANERMKFVDRVCAGDAGLRARVRALLPDAQDAKSFLETPVFEASGPWLSELSSIQPGTEIGGFRITGLIAVGGSSFVYEARQLDPPRRVALKVVATDWAHFERETRLLAALDHPGIAKVLCVGALGDEGMPYLAVEWVEDALPVTGFARESGLAIPARVDLLVEICEAVEYAHARGIVHRDLKPANILVDGQGRSRVIDFGIAKQTELSVGFDSRGLTRTGDVLGTVAYMSPEQCEERPPQVHPRMDVYSLGVVLFELLVGRRPVDIDGCALPEALRRIREEAPRLSLAEGLSSDLVAILARALDKDPEHRYPTAGALAEDLRRFRDHRPIRARPPTLAYHARLFLRRHRSRALAYGALILALLAGAAGTAVQASRAAESERVGRLHAEEVTDFLLSVLALAQPSNAGGLDRPARTLLDDASARIESELVELPESRARIHETISLAYRELGLFDEAADHLEHRLRILRTLDRQSSAELLCTLDNLGEVLVSAGRGVRAETVLREAESIHAQHPELPPFMAAITANRLSGALLQNGKLAEAEACARRALAIYRETLGERHGSVAAAQHSLSEVLLAQGNLVAAREAAERALEIKQAELGPDSLSAALARGHLGRLLAAEGQASEARTQLERAESSMGRFVPPEHPELLATRRTLAHLGPPE